MVLVHRIERIVWAVLVDRVGRIARIVTVHWVEGAVGIVFVDWINRVVRLILRGRVEDIVVPFVARIEARLGVARRDPRAQHRHYQHAVFHGCLLA